MNTQVRCRQAVILLCNKDAVLHTQLLNLHINELIRQGFEDIILLTSQAELPQCISTRRCTIILAEGQDDSDALRNAAGLLNDQFLLVHGDCFFDFNYRALEAVQRHTEGIMVTMALKAGMGRSRFSYASVLDGKVTGLIDTDIPIHRSSHIGTGVYFCDRAILTRIPESAGSFERGTVTALVAAGTVACVVGEGCFVAEPALTREQYEVITQRPALFLDRDGTINCDQGYTHKVEDMKLIDGALELIRTYCDRGWHVFVVTNQSGIARGYFGFDAVERFHDALRNACVDAGGFIHDFEVSPYHESGCLEPYAVANHRTRKPNPGMLLDLMEKWSVIKADSLMVGDKNIDVLAAEAAGIRGLLFDSHNLMQFAVANGLFESQTS